jgi:TolA-binding protein
MQGLLTDYRFVALMVVAVLALLSLIVSLVSIFSGSSLKRRFKKWKSIHASADLEEVYKQTVNEVKDLRRELSRVQEELAQLRGVMRTKVSTARVKRYNAFAQTGSDLSFSIALLDEHQNGVVISSIYGRDESRTYAKPINAGQSTYTLTDEELEVLKN